MLKECVATLSGKVNVVREHLETLDRNIIESNQLQRNANTLLKHILEMKKERGQKMKPEEFELCKRLDGIEKRLETIGKCLDTLNKNLVMYFKEEFK